MGVENPAFFTHKMSTILNASTESEETHLEAIDLIIEEFSNKVDLVTCLKSGITDALLHMCEHGTTNEHVRALKALSKVAELQFGRDLYMPAIERQLVSDLTHAAPPVVLESALVLAAYTDLSLTTPTTDRLIHDHSILPALNAVLAAAEPKSTRVALSVLRNIIRQDQATLRLIELDMATEHSVLKGLAVQLQTGGEVGALPILCTFAKTQLGTAPFPDVPGLLEGMIKACGSTVTSVRKWACSLAALVAVSETSARKAVELGIVPVLGTQLTVPVRQIRISCLETLNTVLPIRTPLLFEQLGELRDILGRRAKEVTMIRSKDAFEEGNLISNLIRYIDTVGIM
ncbi:hypothetical protein J8273_8471 [Carpediemonas membranifera]|uniref:Uncharacterized protein n=1 Tax=Carpediemonas membranifera TaxID=201153 RepID=A0A8J6AW83_9EUKA|nr:hypothetical protein J8273_8471 [Carpediemonas membranifera]|eukprot:KAG9389793.1 hypothetical protein J8273_8471 [Carpediemonas membranifera]